MKAKYPSVFARVYPVKGDVSLPDLLSRKWVFRKNIEI